MLTTEPGGSTRAKACTPGLNGSLSPDATRTATLARAGACVITSACANAAADA